jgi:hypothetical protein
MDELPTYPAAYWNPDHNLTRVYYLTFDGRWRENGDYIDPAIIPLEGLKKLGNYYRERYDEHNVAYWEGE